MLSNAEHVAAGELMVRESGLIASVRNNSAPAVVYQRGTMPQSPSFHADVLQLLSPSDRGKWGARDLNLYSCATLQQKEEAMPSAKIGYCVAIISALSLAACAPRESGPTEVIVVPLFAKGGNGDMNMNTHLGGDEEVLTVAEGAPHPSDSHAQGQAVFRVAEDGTVSVRLIASNIDNVVQAHIHCGRPGENGPVRIWLFPTIGTSGAALTGPTGPQDGVLAEGTFNPTGVICPAANVGTNMPVLDAMRAGLAYVNVHTNDGVSPGNTGPGDFPGGEIRGQLGDKNNP